MLAKVEDYGISAEAVDTLDLKRHIGIAVGLYLNLQRYLSLITGLDNLRQPYIIFDTTCAVADDMRIAIERRTGVIENLKFKIDIVAGPEHICRSRRLCEQYVEVVLSQAVVDTEYLFVAQPAFRSFHLGGKRPVKGNIEYEGCEDCRRLQIFFHFIAKELSIPNLSKRFCTSIPAKITANEPWVSSSQKGRLT